jgi:hypothetical protein
MAQVPLSGGQLPMRPRQNGPLPAPAQPSPAAYAASANPAAYAASASLAALGAQMASPPPSPPPGQPSRDEVPADILNALARSMGEAAATAPLPPLQALAPAPLMPPLAPRAPVAPLDLSTLPPGIAASLARLAGQRIAAPAQAPATPANAAATADNTSLEEGLAQFTRPPAAVRS